MIDRGYAEYQLFQDIIDAGLILCGSPSTVREQLEAQVEAVGMEQLALLFAFGDLPHDKVMRSMRLFAEEVIARAR